jgi:hypothetical protein
MCCATMMRVRPAEGQQNTKLGPMAANEACRAKSLTQTRSVAGTDFASKDMRRQGAGGKIDSDPIYSTKRRARGEQWASYVARVPKPERMWILAWRTGILRKECRR